MIACVLSSQPLLGYVVAHLLAAIVGQVFLLVASLWVLGRRRVAGVAAQPIARVTAVFPGIWDYVWTTQVNSSIRMISREADELIIAWLAGPASLGLFKMAKQFSRVLPMLTDPLYQSIYPELSRAWAAADPRQLLGLVKRSTLLVSLPAMGGWLAFVVLGNELIRWTVGEAYSGAYLPAVIYMLATGNRDDDLLPAPAHARGGKAQVLACGECRCHDRVPYRDRTGNDRLGHRGKRGLLRAVLLCLDNRGRHHVPCRHGRRAFRREGACTCQRGLTFKIHNTTFPIITYPTSTGMTRARLHRSLPWGLEYLCYMTFIADVVARHRPKSLLDVGCGDGRLLHMLRGRVPSITGMDLSENAIRFARAFNPDCDVRCADIATLKERFEWITLIEVLEHIADGDVPRFIGAIAARLQPAGRLLLSVPTTNRPLSGKHYRHYNLSLLAEHLGPAFEIEQTWWLWHCGWRQKLLSRLACNRLYVLNNGLLLRQLEKCLCAIGAARHRRNGRAFGCLGKEHRRLIGSDRGMTTTLLEYLTFGYLASGPAEFPIRPGAPRARGGDGSPQGCNRAELPSPATKTNWRQPLNVTCKAFVSKAVPRASFLCAATLFDNPPACIANHALH